MCWAALGGLLITLTTLTLDAATAEGRTAKRGKPLRLAGIIDPAGCDAAPCLGILRLQAGETVRRLGVTMAQADSTEGMAIFSGFALQSQSLRLLAPTPTIQPFLDAAPGTPVQIWGLFQGLNLVVAQLTVTSAPVASGTVASTPVVSTPVGQ